MVYTMPRLPNYQCPRCGHETNRKHDMMKHFENRKTPCPACFNVIELSQEIKDFVLQNRIYKVVQNTNHVVNNIVHQYNVFQNILTRMDPIDKITEYIKQKEIAMVDFEQNIETSFAHNINRLQSASYHKFTLQQKNLLDIVDRVTAFDDIQNMNMIYDERGNQLKVLQNGKWASLPFESGVETIMELIKSAYLDHYECYLLRKWYSSDSAWDKKYFTEYIEEYFKFISAFDLQPFVVGTADEEILNNASGLYTLEEKFYPVYRKITDDRKSSEVRNTRQRVYHVIKSNSKANINQLNRQLLELLRMDEAFKQNILERLAV